jgi:ABC-type antimicrobial peptide transport system permease subunit
VGFADGLLTVIGVAEHSVSGSVTENPRAFVYLPSFAYYSSRQNFIIAGDGSAASLIEPVDAAMREFNPNLAITPLLLSDLIDEQLASLRIWSALVLSIAGVALFLALVGLYGVQASLVSRRTREIGIRMALGAEVPGIVGRVVGSGMVMGGLGALLGVGTALALSGVLRGMVFGVAPNDPLTLTIMPALLLLACFVASLIPALRASHVDPVEALRED